MKFHKKGTIEFEGEVTEIDYDYLNYYLGGGNTSVYQRVASRFKKWMGIKTELDEHAHCILYSVVLLLATLIEMNLFSIVYFAITFVVFYLKFFIYITNLQSSSKNKKA